MENRHKTMSDLIRKKDPRMVRLGALRTYQKLSQPARGLVKRLVLDGIHPANLPDTDTRSWNSDAVQTCLAAFGYCPPKRAVIAPPGPSKPIPEVQPTVEVPCEPCGMCTTVGPHTSRHNSLLVCNACLCRASNIHAVAPPRPEKCWECGADAQPTWDDRWLCPTHFASAASSQSQQSSAEFAAAVARRNEQGDPNINDIGTLRGLGNDYAKSVQIWEQQARDEADGRQRDREERAQAEAQYHHARADYIQRGGRF